MIFTVSAPTTIPRTSLFTQLLWLPFANRSNNPFTGYTAEDLEEETIDANSPVLEFGIDFASSRPRRPGAGSAPVSR
jgi:hypothetical protein